MLRQSHAHVLDVIRSLTNTPTRAFTVTAPSLARLSPEVHESTEDHVPRWLRRQNLQKGKEKEDDIVLPRPKEVQVYRSKHITSNPGVTKETKRETIKLLEPHVLSQRIKKLCDRGKLDDAVSLLKNSPLGAQNTPVWNTLIWETMKAKRYKLAYSLYTDMKRRGHSPTTRTFQTMFSGLAHIEDFSKHTQQLKNALSLYDSFTRHLKSVKRINPADPELSVDPLASYIKILGNARRYNDVFEVFHSLEPDGPLSTNLLIFTSMFQVLASRPAADTPTFRQADARILWAQVVKASKRNPSFIIDSHLATSAISALTRGQTSDHDVGFQIARDFFGLCPPGTSRVAGSFPLSPQAISAIFRLCNGTNNFDLTIDFFDEVKRRPVHLGGAEILDWMHMEEVLWAHQALNVAASGYQSLQTLEWMLRQEITGSNGGRIRPQMSTFHMVLVTCWHSADWSAATRTFDLMTGYHSHDFMDGAVTEQPRLDRRAKGRNLIPTAETMSSLVRAAYATRNRAHMRQCLRIVDYLGLDGLLSRTTENAEESRKSVKNRGFFVAKLAQGIVEMVDYLLAGTTDQNFPKQSARWKNLLHRAKMELRDSGEAALIPTLQRNISAKETPLMRIAHGSGRREARAKFAMTE
ncbi:hypothetical protein D9756_000630 [Leucocoprinus leucothites]|uniref:Pentatricopeptide repeat-containing protein n=1 Tax=Leucocoprinus leucothites TaxID=201217 RepID=A0A8H5GFY0_9AGAR|nr:hypothetical protein D9756_000630 [Leucoagaricus leucothites]